MEELIIDILMSMKIPRFFENAISAGEFGVGAQIDIIMNVEE